MRRGFTLVEMLVVILIIMLLAGLVMAFLPGVSARQQAERGGVLLRTEIKQMQAVARRDSGKVGLRFSPSTVNPAFCRAPQPIQVPDDFGGGTVAANGANVTITADTSLGAVQIGDTIEFGGCGLPHQITAIGNGTLTLASPLAVPVATTSQYRIMRSPRLLVGSMPLQLPADIGIDLSRSGYFQGTLSTAGSKPLPLTDLMFGKSGETSYEAVVFWVRDMVSADPAQPFSVLVVIYRNGVVTQLPVDVGTDSYTFIRKPTIGM